MSQYFFKMSQAEKNNILDQHKSIYDGFVTQFGQTNNTQPLYVQDYANDKVGLVVTNKGVVKSYTNMGINESKLPLDQIGDSESDLENGTVDFDNDNTLHHNYDTISLGSKIDSDEDDFYDEINNHREFSRKEKDDDLRLDFIDYNDDEDEDLDFISSHDFDLTDDVPVDLKEDFNAKWVETLDMFNRILK
jgi:hypothetical protein